MKSQLFVPLALLALGLVLLAQSANAQDYSNIRIVRLSFVEGTVQYQRPDQDWQVASLNLPIQQGFSLRTADGYAEVEFEDSLVVRLGTNSTVEFTVLALLNGGRFSRLTVPRGTVIVSAKPGREDFVSVGAANLTVKVPHSGRFRVDVSSTESWVTVLHGKVEIDSAPGTNSLLSGGHTLHQDANASSSPEIASNPPQDAFDKWVSQREDAVTSARSETSDIFGSTSYMEGFADLYDYGVWSYIPGYGAGWVPYGLGEGWMPFVNGQWQFMGGLGWDWVSGEPWGWLPYHFGSWVNSPGIGWAWLPVGSPSWLPATASWVQVNNQLGWIPNGPPQVSKPVKSREGPAPPIVILAAQGASGAIRAGGRLPLSQAAMSMRAVSAPLPSFIAPARPATQAVAQANGFARSTPVVQSTGQFVPASLARGAGAPASLRAPSAPTAQPRVARLSSIPGAVMAPHSLPAPPVARGALAGGFGGGFGGPRGVINGPAASTGARSGAVAHSSAAGAASHSGGSSGSGGHH